MYVHETPPFTFRTEDILDPNDLNENAAYVARVGEAVFQKRYTHSILTLPYVLSCATGYSHTDSQELRRYRFKCHQTVVLERIILIGNVSAGAEVTVDLYVESTGLAPSGVTNPILTVADGSLAAVEERDLFGQSVVLSADVEYCLELKGTSFSTQRLDLQLHLRADRFNIAGTDEYPAVQPALYTEADTLDGPAISADVAACAAVVTAGVALTTGVKPMFFQATGFTTSTDADLLRFSIPRVDSGAARSRVVRIFGYAVMASAPAPGSGVIFTLETSAGSSLATAIAGVSGAAFGSGSSSTAVNLAGSGVDSGTTSDDYRLVISSNTAVSCGKAYAYIWIE